MSLLFYLFTFAINLWHRKFITADVTAVFVNNQQGIQQRVQDFDKKRLYLKGYTANRLTDEFPEKSWTKRGPVAAKHPEREPSRLPCMESHAGTSLQDCSV